LENYLVQWTQLMGLSDAIIKKMPASSTENRFFPFSGNGKLGFGLDKDKKQFYLKTESHGYIQSFAPTLDFKIQESHIVEEKAVIMNVKAGLVILATVFDVEQSCVLVEETFFAHRLHSGLFQHVIKVKNSGPFSIDLELSTVDVKKLKKIEKIHTAHHTNGHLATISGEIKTKRNKENKEGLVKFTSVLSSVDNRVLKVPQKGEKSMKLLSYTDFIFLEQESQEIVPPTNKTRTGRDVKDTDIIALTEKSNTMLKSLSKDHLQDQHVKAWSEIWTTGISISSDSDPNSPSPLHVNLTQYYLYTTHSGNSTKKSTKSVNCYTGPPTLHYPKHWVVPTSLSSLSSLMQLWEDFFTRNNCPISSLTAFSLPQLMVLTIVGLHYHNKQLQMALNPLNLRTNISLRHVSLDYFHSQDQFDLKVLVTNIKTEPYQIYVMNNGKHSPKIFGCGSACEHVVELGSSRLKFVIHPTDPVTPLFYISSNRTLLEKIHHSDFMRKAIHSAKEIKATAHHHQLSPKFWISVVVLIVSFHVIVLKMIYNECRKGRGTVPRRGPYS